MRISDWSSDVCSSDLVGTTAARAAATGEQVMHDLVIRRGIVVDGTGAERRVADVAVDGGRIGGVGRDDGRGRREIDAGGLLGTTGLFAGTKEQWGGTEWVRTSRSRVEPVH